MFYRRRCLVVAVFFFLLTGCATPLHNARNHFFLGEYQKAEEELASVSVSAKDRVLFLMERGTLRQAAGDYKGSATDFIAAGNELKELETYSLSKGAASLVINDMVQAFQGTPFERTLLHGFTSLDHLALGHWDDAAVESRKILQSLDKEVRGDFPADAFSHYIAGFGLEMINDPSNAAMQYRLAVDLAQGISIDETGHFLNTDNAPEEKQQQDGESPWQTELVCAVLLGKSPSGRDIWHGNSFYEPALFSEIYVGGRYLGRSYPLADTAELAAVTMQQQAVAQAVKTTSRVVLKEGIALAVDENYGEGYGALVRLIFIALLEQPDIRRWETLPRRLQIARVACPPDLGEFEVVTKDQYGAVVNRARIVYPISRRGNTFFSIYRDLPVQPKPDNNKKVDLAREQ